MLNVTDLPTSSRLTRGVLVVLGSMALAAISALFGVPAQVPIINVLLMLPMAPIIYFLRRRNGPNLRQQIIIAIAVTTGLAGLLTRLLTPAISKWLQIAY